MSGALKSGGVALPKAARAFGDHLAKAAPGAVQDFGVYPVAPAAQGCDNCFERVDRVIAGRGVCHANLLCPTAFAVSNSPASEHLPSRKGCASSEADARRKRTDWTPERLTILADFFEAGWSHELMAQALGVSKGAISGKLDRLAEADPKRWTRSATVIAIRPDRSGIAAKAEGRRALATVTKAVEESVVGVALLGLEPQHCRWPVAYTTEQTFCGAVRHEGSSYCGDHSMRSTAR